MHGALNQTGSVAKEETVRAQRARVRCSFTHQAVVLAWFTRTVGEEIPLVTLQTSFILLVTSKTAGEIRLTVNTPLAPGCVRHFWTGLIERCAGCVGAF